MKDYKNLIGMKWNNLDEETKKELLSLIKLDENTPNGKICVKFTDYLALNTQVYRGVLRICGTPILFDPNVGLDRPDVRYRKKNKEIIKSYSLSYNSLYNKDIIDKLDSTDNYSDYIRQLIRADIANEK